MWALEVVTVAAVLIAIGPLVRMGAAAGVLEWAALPGAALVIAIWRALGPRAELVAWAVFLALLGTLYLDPAVAVPNPPREMAAALGGVTLAALGLWLSPWFIAAGLGAHVAWDFLPRELSTDFASLPVACLVFDGAAAAYAGWQVYLGRWTPLRARRRTKPIRLRPATADDLAFIARVHRASMRPHVERVYGAWDDAEQRARLEASTDPATHEIVELAGEPIGCQWVREHPGTLELVRLYLLPEVQGRGIGSQLLAQLCARADAERVGVRLQVLRGNPAQRFYARHGFELASESSTHFAMARKPG